MAADRGAFICQSQSLNLFVPSANFAKLTSMHFYAWEKGLKTVGFTGETGGKMKELSDYLVNVPSANTPRIQESHIMLGHIICQLVEEQYFK